MPEFEGVAPSGDVIVSVNTDGENGAFALKIGKHKPIHLTLQTAKVLSEQIGYAVEFVNLYDRGPR